MKYETELPNGFKSWSHLYHELKKSNDMDAQYCEFGMFNGFSPIDRTVAVRNYYYETQYIKSKVFDEISEHDLTISDLNSLINMVMGTQYFSDYSRVMVDKLKALIRVRL